MLSNKKIDFNDYQGSDVVKEIGQQRNETFSVNMHGVSKSIKFGKLIGLEEREARYIIDLIDNHVKENIIL
jgi:hypothetical protein